MTSNLLSDGGYEASSMWTGHGTRQVAQHEPEVAGPVTDGRPMNQSYWLALLNHDAYAASFQSVGQYRSALIERASSPRAQPEREGPTDEEWEDLKERLWDQYQTVGYQGERFMYDADFYTALDVARQEITRHARPTIEPVPVAERLPGPEDCDAKGRCWVGCPEFSDDGDYGPTTFNPSWELAPFAQGDTHWRPHNALPVPGAEVQS